MAANSPRSHSTTLLLAASAVYWAAIYVYLPILAVHAEKNLGASMGLVGVVLAAYGLPQLLFRIPLGMWSDRIGLRKPFLYAGFVMAGIGGLVLALSTVPELLVVGRGMSGLAAAGWVTITVLFASYYPPEKATRAMALLTFVGGASQMVASYAGGMIAQNYGWTAPFWVALGLSMVGLVLSVPVVEKPVLVRRRESIEDLIRIARVPLLVAVTAITVMTSWAMYATWYGFSPVYAASLGADRAELGILTTVAQAAYTIASLAAGYLADWIGIRGTMILGLGSQMAGAFGVPLSRDLFGVGITQVLGGAGRGFSYPVCMGLSIQAVAQPDRARAMGVFQAVYAVGMFLGPATTGMLADSLGMASVFIVAGVAPIIGIGIVLALIPKKRRAASGEQQA